VGQTVYLRKKGAHLDMKDSFFVILRMVELGGILTLSMLFSATRRTTFIMVVIVSFEVGTCVFFEKILQVFGRKKTVF
jgi:hypothetical protein